MTATFASFLQAGFDPGHLPWSGLDLLEATGHVPDRNMAANYAVVQALGIRAVRDGLPWRHDPGPRLRTADRFGLEVIWDLCHFDPPLAPEAHARTIAEQVPCGSPLWVCPMNEPAICSSFNADFSAYELAYMGLTMARILKAELPDVRCVTTDPIVGAGGCEYASTDVLVDAGIVDVVGVNYYPHTARTWLSTVLIDTWRRYGLPVLLAETSWHNGHQEQFQAFPHIRHKADWLQHVLVEIRLAQRAGAEIVGCCWYPATDTPSWNGDDAIWDNGLLRLDGRLVDEQLAEAMKAGSGT